MTQKIASLILLLSILASAWIYWGSDFKTRQHLMSREWQGHIITLLENDGQALTTSEEDTPLKKVDIISNVKYLPNKTYIRNSVLKLYSNGNVPESIINISEVGTWELSDNYLLISPEQFKDVSSNQSKDFSPEQLNLVTQFFKLDAQQSRKVNIIDDRSILLTSLNHDSTLLYSY